MLMTAAVHMDSAARGHGPSSTLPPTPTPPPWLPLLAADEHNNNNRHHQLLRDVAASAPSPTPATATTAPPNHHHLRPARRVAKRRPRPSRKLPTTYIAADPASFRRMVHQVTGADDLPLPVPVPTETLCRPAPYRAGAAAPTGAMMLPTLDTSAFLLELGAPGVPARTDAPCGGPAVLEAAPTLDRSRRTEAGGACDYSSNSNSGSSCCGGFPTLDSWDDALF